MLIDSLHFTYALPVWGPICCLAPRASISNVCTIGTYMSLLIQIQKFDHCPIIIGNVRQNNLLDPSIYCLDSTMIITANANYICIPPVMQYHNYVI